jgi:hypothetical protein
MQRREARVVERDELPRVLERRPDDVRDAGPGGGARHRARLRQLALG